MEKPGLSQDELQLSYDRKIQTVTTKSYNIVHTKTNLKTKAQFKCLLCHPARNRSNWAYFPHESRQAGTNMQQYRANTENITTMNGNKTDSDTNDKTEKY